MSEQQPQSLGAAAVRSLRAPVELDWQRVNLIGGALAVIGIIGFVLALALGDTHRVWPAYLVSFLFFTGVAQGGVILSVGFYLTQGRWARRAVHMRVAEAGWPFLLLSVLLFAGVFLGRVEIFPWITHPAVKKAAWLNTRGLFTRDWLALAVMALVSVWFVRISRGPIAKEWAAKSLTIEMPPKGIRRLGPILAILYIYLYSILALDLIMSLSPLWHSTLFGWWWFAMCFWSGICAASLVASRFYRLLGEGSVFRDPTVLHDFGKLVFAFSIFWIYLSFAQYLVIWYGDLPTETFFIITRFWHRPWTGLAWAGPFLIWLVPFVVLMAVAPKKNPAILGTVAILGLVGVWLTDYVMIVPSLSPNRLPLGWVEVSIAAGFLGLFLLCAVPGLRLAARAAVAPVDEF
jgi:hypothetical protein